MSVVDQKWLQVIRLPLIKRCSRLYYPVAILDEILNTLPNYQVGVLYDIGCHLDVHIKKVEVSLAFSMTDY